MTEYEHFFLCNILLVCRCLCEWENCKNLGFAEDNSILLSLVEVIENLILVGFNSRQEDFSGGMSFADILSETK